MMRQIILLILSLRLRGPFDINMLRKWIPFWLVYDQRCASRYKMRLPKKST